MLPSGLRPARLPLVALVAALVLGLSVVAEVIVRRTSDLGSARHWPVLVAASSLGGPRSVGSEHLPRVSTFPAVGPADSLSAPVVAVTVQPVAAVVPHRVVKHRVVKHRVVKHRVVKHRVVKHRAVKHRVVKHRAAPRPAARSGAGHYLRSLRARPSDVPAMRSLGAADARRNRATASSVVLLDIGGQVRGGVRLSTTTHFVSYRSLVRALDAYVDGYHSQQGNVTVTIALGTNNDLIVGTGTGRDWAAQVVNPVLVHAAQYAGMSIAGADDVEPGFSSGPRAAVAWLTAYLRTTSAPFVFNGSADGCSTTRARSHCNGGWTSSDLVRISATMAPDRTLVLPQIYNSDMERQWVALARAAAIGSQPRMRIVGALTENAACGRDPSCPTMPSGQARSRLAAGLGRSGMGTTTLAWGVDLDVH